MTKLFYTTIDYILKTERLAYHHTRQRKMISVNSSTIC